MGVLEWWVSFGCVWEMSGLGEGSGAYFGVFRSRSGVEIQGAMWMGMWLLVFFREILLGWFSIG